MLRSVSSVFRALSKRRVALAASVALLSGLALGPGANSALAARRAPRAASNSYSFSLDLHGKSALNGFTKAGSAGELWIGSGPVNQANSFAFTKTHTGSTRTDLATGVTVIEAYSYSIGRFASPNTMSFGTPDPSNPLPSFSESATWSTAGGNDVFKMTAGNLGKINHTTATTCVDTWNRTATLTGKLAIHTMDTFLGDVKATSWPVTMYETRTSTDPSCNKVVNNCPQRTTRISAFRTTSTGQLWDAYASKPNSGGTASVTVAYSANATSSQPLNLVATMAATGLPTSSFMANTTLTSAKVAPATKPWITGELDFTGTGSYGNSCTYNSKTYKTTSEMGNATDTVTAFVAHFEASSVGDQRVTGGTTLTSPILSKTV